MNTLITLSKLKAEWPLLRTAVFETFPDTMESLTWQQVNKQFGTEYPHALSLFDVILSIPATSTAFKRGLTHMKLIKSNRRTCMKEATLSNCLTIKLEGPSILDFNPEKAIDVWFQKAVRRPGTSGSQDNRSEASEAAAYSVVLLDDEEEDEQSVEKEKLYMKIHLSQ